MRKEGVVQVSRSLRALALYLLVPRSQPRSFQTLYQPKRPSNHGNHIHGYRNLSLDNDCVCGIGARRYVAGFGRYPTEGQNRHG